jgi:HEPN domain-containing protein
MPHSDTSPEYWLELPQDDEESARILVRESASPDIAAYHFHQVIEKRLKAILAGKGADVPRIHDLECLFKKAQSLDVDILDDVADGAEEQIDCQ